MRGWIIIAAVAALLVLPACGSSFVQANLSAPAVTEDGTVWWAEHRANERGYNDTRIIMCKRGEDPVCIRLRPGDYE
jgi:hypothetical protein